MTTTSEPPRERTLAQLADPTPNVPVGVGAAVELVASRGSGGTHLDLPQPGIVVSPPRDVADGASTAVNGVSLMAVSPFGGPDAPAAGRWSERGAISHPAPAPTALAVPPGVNTGKGAYITPGARVVVRTEGESWPGYVVGDNCLGELWVRHPDGYEVRVRWTQVSATR